MLMVITYRSMNMLKGSSLSIYKVLLSLPFSRITFNGFLDFLRHSSLMLQVRLSLDLNGFISVRRRNSRGTLMQKVHQRNLMSSEQSLQGLQGNIDSALNLRSSLLFHQWLVNMMVQVPLCSQQEIWRFLPLEMPNRRLLVV